MASEGPNDPGTAANDATVGSTAWTDLPYVLTQNDLSARCTLFMASSYYLKVTNFGFSIPDGATIDGILVEVDKWESVSGSATDNSAKIVLSDGSIGGEEKKNIPAWPTSDTDTYDSYGGSSDLWSETWTAADINDSDFGFVLSGNAPDATSEPIFVDHIRITVYYTEVVGTNMKINISDVFKDIDSVKINIGDAWKNVIKIQKNIGDVWKDVFG